MTVSTAQLRRVAKLPLQRLVSGDVVSAAAGLIGCVLARRLPSGELRQARIVETEAYHMREPGSHSFRGKTPRNATMFGPPGHLYVYFTYGMWHCCNVVCEPEGVAAGVLLRAGEPLPPHDGSDHDVPALRLSGPGLLCQGLEIDRSDDGTEILSGASPIWIYRPDDYTLPELEWTRRVGLGIDEELLWRCHWKGHGAVSKGRPGPVSRVRKR